MNAEKTKRTPKPKAAAIALVTVLALLASPLCPLNCSGADCRMRQTTSTHGEECHGAAQTDSVQMQPAKVMVCEAPALAARSESSAERLWKISRLSAGTAAAEAMNSSALAYFLGEPDLRWGAALGPGQQLAETRSILTLRI
jgi:hypothetical protein